MNSIYEVTQYALSNAGIENKKQNPDHPFGCRIIDTEIVDKFLSDEYESHVQDIKNKSSRIHGGVLEGGEIIDLVSWCVKIHARQEACLSPLNIVYDPSFVFESTRGYVKDNSHFELLVNATTEEELALVYNLVEGYYTRFRLTHHFLGLNTMPNDELDLFYSYCSDTGRLVSDKPWTGMTSNFISSLKLKFEQTFLPNYENEQNS